MEKHLRPRKSLGQNFLTDDNIARKIVRTAEIHSDDIVLEIGPGKGALTRHLLEKTEQLITVEIDKRVAEHLEKRFERESSTGRLQIIQEDFLSVDLGKIAREYGKPIRIIGNIPYYITSPILFKIIEERESVRDLTILVQLEVGKRIVAKPKSKEYGILSVFCQFYGTPELLFKVPATAFSPRPKVVSVLLRLDFTRRPVYKVADEKLFVGIVRATFGKRRKTLRNGLKYLELEGFDPEVIDFDLNHRPEELSVEDFVHLSNLIEIQIHAERISKS